jgi:CRISPR type III-A-associated RAMP protein Csm4
MEGGASGPRDSKDALREEMAAADDLRGLARAPFVSESVFRGIMTEGMGLAKLWDKARATSPTLVRHADVWMGAEEARGLPDVLHKRAGWRDLDIPRNHIDRIAGATVEGMLFSVTARFFHQDVGLWFALQSERIEPFHPLLRYLQDTGIGGHRTSGISQFAIPLPEIHEVTIPSAPGSDRLVTLSRYVPAAGEVRFDDPRAAYRIIPLQPKHESGGPRPGQRIYKGRLMVLEEGSILPVTGERKKFYGRAVAVGRNTEDSDGFSVWHNGVTIPAFMAKEKANA